MTNRELPEKWQDWSITEKIGAGTFGSVYKAVRQEKEQTRVSAIKVIRIPDDRTNEDIRCHPSAYDTDRLVRIYGREKEKALEEVRIMLELKGQPNIVPLEDYAVVPQSNGYGWDIFLRMEYLTALPDYLKNHSMSSEEVRRLGIDICQVLHICEQKGIFHRDIKPGNLFVSPDGNFRLGDFGIAVHSNGRKEIHSDAGTDLYLAPEARNRKQYCLTSDQYSLGLVLYDLLNKGRNPFFDLEKRKYRGREFEEADRKRLNGTPWPSPAEGTPVLHAILRKACAFDPDQRFHSALAFEQALKEAA